MIPTDCMLYKLLMQSIKNLLTDQREQFAGMDWSEVEVFQVPVGREWSRGKFSETYFNICYAVFPIRFYSVIPRDHCHNKTNTSSNMVKRYMGYQ